MISLHLKIPHVLYFLKDTPEYHGPGCRVPVCGAILMYVGYVAPVHDLWHVDLLEKHRFLYEGVVVVGNFEKGRIDEVFQPC